MDADGMPEGSQGASRESRFSHLLQPIRDLAQNWNIDVASELEEYMQEIEGLKFTFDGSKETFSFAEAAMLIQGSACIYSKKVEYLYALVYETLDLIASKRRTTQVAADSDEFPAEVAEQFLPLDDLAEDKNIDLRNDAPVRELIPRTPAGLLPVEKEFDTALTTAKGVVLGNRNDFRMNTSVVHDTGTLLLGADDHRFLDASFRQAPSAIPPAAPEQSHVTFNDDDFDIGGGMDFDDHDGAHALPEGFATSTPFLRREDAPAPGTADVSTMGYTQGHAASAASQKNAADAWARLDPHTTGEEKPFSRMKASRMPKILTGKSTAKPLPSIAEFCSRAYKSNSGRKLPQNTFLAPAYPELQAHFWQEQRRRADLVKPSAPKSIASGSTTAAAAAAAAAPTAEWGGFHDDDCNDGGFGDHSDHEYEQVPLPEPAAVPAPLSMVFEDAPVGSSYEDLVRKHVERYMIESQKYVQDSDLSRRVQQWEARMRPVLEAEEHHAPFDIHQYGENLLHRFPRGKRSTADFETITQGAEVYEVCRLFLAALQLANTGNVELIPPRQEGDHLALRKLSDKLPHKALEDFLAPSLLE